VVHSENLIPVRFAKFQYPDFLDFHIAAAMDALAAGAIVSFETLFERGERKVVAERFSNCSFGLSVGWAGFASDNRYKGWHDDKATE
jgi:hypothetical protein